jgi:hypothetical protein
MLSRLSSFSGPLSPAFRIPIGGFTANGLILRYVIKDINSYTGTNNVIDLVGNSNATLINGPTFSSNGYLNFDGVNDYLMTNTSLDSLFPGTSPNKSEITSFFIWVYPQDNGVILTEQGLSTLNGGWHDSQIEMVSGSLKLGMWNGTGITSITSSIQTPFNNWYYVGIVYNGSTLVGYVNGQPVGSVTFNREAPYNFSTGLHYGIAAADFTSQGDGTYAKMKMGDFHVYNTALTQQQILNNYNTTKNNYIHTGSMSIWIDANDPQSFSGGLISDLSGNEYTHTLGSGATSSTIFGFKSFNLTSLSNGQISVNGTGPTLSTSGYTYVAWARVTSDSSVWRTLYRSNPNDHPLLIQIGTDDLGFFDNDSFTFQDSGYDVSQIKEKWIQYSVVGDSSSSIFYINDVQVGSVSYGAGGNKHWLIGLDGQPFGYVGNMILYNKKLNQEQIKQNYDALKHVYSNGDFLTNNLVLYYNPASLLSYPSSGTTVTDLTNNSLNGVMSNVTHNQTYFNFNGSNSQISIADNSLLEPGSGDWTMESWFYVNSLPTSAVILGKFNNGGAAANVSYSIRLNTLGNLFAQFSNGVAGTFVNSTSYTVSLNTWYQVVYVWTNSGSTKTLETFINGSSIGTVNHSFTSILNSTNPLYLGSYNNGEYPQYLSGKIGIVRLYNSALSSSDVLKNFEANRNTYGI